MAEEKQKRSFFKKLTDTYRLVIIDEDTFEHKLDFSLSRLNVFVVTGVLALLLIAGTTLLIAYTPLREYIPGYPSTKLKKQVYHLSVALDSLNREMEIRNRYNDRLRMALSGDIQPENVKKAMDTSGIVKVDSLNLLPSHEDSLLREEVSRQEAFRVKKINNSLPRFIPPVRGPVSRHFEPDKGHYGIDIILPQNTPVKAIAAGRIIFAGWTPQDGNVLIISHKGQYISIYKHNQKLLKKAGELVKAGEVIARAGNTGERTTGPHLHFELWYKDHPVDPALYINF
jgi:murein DD-endopeptidase MepM/ murein hydrolase activator NlpD